MPKPIRITEKIKQKLVEDFIKSIQSNRLKDGAVTFNKELTTEDERARIVFSQEAMIQTLALLAKYDTEVGWYGVCRKVPNEKATYRVERILVYPQTVTGATVQQTDADTVQDAEWKNEMDDYTFNNLRFHGHSHVDMSTFASGTDQKLYNTLVDSIYQQEKYLEDDRKFFVFMVFNKSLNIWANIYDIADNKQYTEKEIDISVEGCNMQRFLSEAKDMVKTYTPPKAQYTNPKTTVVKSNPKSKNGVKYEEETEEEYDGYEISYYCDDDYEQAEYDWHYYLDYIKGRKVR